MLKHSVVLKVHEQSPAQHVHWIEIESKKHKTSNTHKQQIFLLVSGKQIKNNTFCSPRCMKSIFFFIPKALNSWYHNSLSCCLKISWQEGAFSCGHFLLLGFLLFNILVTWSSTYLHLELPKPFFLSFPLCLRRDLSYWEERDRGEGKAEKLAMTGCWQEGCWMWLGRPLSPLPAC